MSIAALSATPPHSIQARVVPVRRRVTSSRNASTSSSNRRFSRTSLRAAATEQVTPDGVFDTAPASLPVTPNKDPPTVVAVTVTVPLACPVSLKPLDSKGFAPESGLRYAKADGVWNLTIGSAVNSKSAGPVSLTDLARSFLPKDLKGLLPTSAYMGTATFETPQVAFAYERGWRDSFKRAGFPGPEEEFELAQAQLLPHAKHKILLDASCGSGLFTRRFVQSKNYASVVGLDFSAAMLTQARAFAKDEGLLSNEDDETDETDETDGLVFVRADIARIPFPQESIAGVHAGAAIHCWPDCRAAVAEIARVLEPGGSFCGTTFLSPRLPFADNKAQRQIDAVLREVSDAIAGPGGQRGFRQWNVLDLEELMVECGLVDFKADVRDPGFVFYAARKPKKWTEE